MLSYSLDDAEKTAAEFPETFEIPSRHLRESVPIEGIVKLVFRFESETNAFVERMWVIVKERFADGSYLGILDNDPSETDLVRSGLEVNFGPEHIIDIWRG